MKRVTIRFNKAMVRIGDHVAHISDIIAKSPGMLYIKGPNGSGKTILLKTIVGLDEINEILYTGIKVEPENTRKWFCPSRTMAHNPWRYRI